MAMSETIVSIEQEKVFPELKKIKDMLVVYPNILAKKQEISTDEREKFLKSLELIEKNYVGKDPERAKKLMVIYFNMIGVIIFGSVFPTTQDIENYKKNGEKLTRDNFIKAKIYFGLEIKEMERGIKGNPNGSPKKAT